MFLYKYKSRTNRKILLLLIAHYKRIEHSLKIVIGVILQILIGKHFLYRLHICAVACTCFVIYNTDNRLFPWTLQFVKTVYASAYSYCFLASRDVYLKVFVNFLLYTTNTERT